MFTGFLEQIFLQAELALEVSSLGFADTVGDHVGYGTGTFALAPVFEAELYRRAIVDI